MRSELAKAQTNYLLSDQQEVAELKNKLKAESKQVAGLQEQLKAKSEEIYYLQKQKEAEALQHSHEKQELRNTVVALEESLRQEKLKHEGQPEAVQNPVGSGKPGANMKGLSGIDVQSQKPTSQKGVELSSSKVDKGGDKK